MIESKICHVTSVHGWNDIRIFKKQCTSLAKHFSEVSLVAPNGPTEKVNGVNVYGVEFEGIKNRRKRFLQLRKLIIQKAIEVDADIYQFHDPELLPFTNKLKKLGKKVIYDSHENVPAAILTKDWLKYNWIKKTISKTYNKYEKKTSLKCDAIISVLPEITNTFKHSLSETIYNYPLLESTTPVVKSYTKGDVFNIVYHGGLTKQRGIKEICLAIASIKRDNIKLHLMGAWESKSFEEECVGIIEDKSKFKNYGVLSFEDCQELLKEMHLGLVLFHHSPNHLFSLPNKLHEYLINGMPVIMSDIPYWMDEFSSTVEFADPHTTTAVVSKIEGVMDNYNDIQTKITEFQKVIIENQSWQAEEKKLVDFYKKVIAQ
jgi:glycosyltransferase involved in cell wall biosynthesis